MCLDASFEPKRLRFAHPTELILWIRTVHFIQESAVHDLGLTVLRLYALLNFDVLRGCCRPELDPETARVCVLTVNIHEGVNVLRRVRRRGIAAGRCQTLHP